MHLDSASESERARNKILRDPLTATCDGGTFRLASDFESEKPRERLMKLNLSSPCGVREVARVYAARPQAGGSTRRGAGARARTGGPPFPAG